MALVSGAATNVMSAASDADGLALRCPTGANRIMPSMMTTEAAVATAAPTPA